MPEPGDLRRVSADGEVLVFAGSVLLFRFAEQDAAARNVAVAVLRQLGFSGQAVAAAMGLTENYVATLHRRALREGTGGLVRPRGRPGKLAPQAWEQARQWRAAGVRDAEIARRLGVEQSTVLRRLGPASVQDELPEKQPWPAPEELPAGEPQPARDEPAPEPEGPEPLRTRSPLRIRCPWPPPGKAAWPRPDPAAGPRGPARTAGAGWRPGMRARCCCTPSAAGPARRRSWPPRPAGRMPGLGTRRCCRRSACASLSARPRSSSSSTWPRPMPGRWPGWARCRACGRCGRGWPRSPTAPTRCIAAPVRVRDAGRRPGCLRGILRR